MQHSKITQNLDAYWKRRLLSKQLTFPLAIFQHDKIGVLWAKILFGT